MCVRAGTAPASAHAERRHLKTLGICAYTDTGVIGQPLRATKEEHAMLLSVAPNLAGLPAWFLMSSERNSETGLRQGLDDIE
jgi:hypothetical protein